MNPNQKSTVPLLWTILIYFDPGWSRKLYPVHLSVMILLPSSTFSIINLFKTELFLLYR